MKYMHLNSSCPYAGLANMLTFLGVDTEDDIIASEIDLASHIRFDETRDVFTAGLSLQDKNWFDLFLNPRGFSYQEEFWTREKVQSRLCPGMMIGIFVEPGRKHAVVCAKAEEDRFEFLNNKWEQMQEPEILVFSPEELLARLPEDVAVGWVQPGERINLDLRPVYGESLRVWEFYREKIRDFSKQLQSAQELRRRMNSLFRPLLLDGLTMAQLRKDHELAEILTVLQGQYLSVLRLGQPAVLSESMDMCLLEKAFDRITEYVRVQYRKICQQGVG